MLARQVCQPYPLEREVKGDLTSHTAPGLESLIPFYKPHILLSWVQPICTRLAGR